MATWGLPIAAVSLAVVAFAIPHTRAQKFSDVSPAPEDASENRSLSSIRAVRRRSGGGANLPPPNEPDDKQSTQSENDSKVIALSDRVAARAESSDQPAAADTPPESYQLIIESAPAEVLPRRRGFFGVFGSRKAVRSLPPEPERASDTVSDEVAAHETIVDEVRSAVTAASAVVDEAVHESVLQEPLEQLEELTPPAPQIEEEVQAPPVLRVRQGVENAGMPEEVAGVAEEAAPMPPPQRVAVAPVGIAADDVSVDEVDLPAGPARTIERISSFFAFLRRRRGGTDLYLVETDAERILRSIQADEQRTVHDEPIGLSSDRIAAVDARLAEIADTPVFEAPEVPIEALIPGWVAEFADLGMDVSVDGRERILSRAGLYADEDLTATLERVFLTENVVRVRVLGLMLVQERRLVALVEFVKSAGASEDAYERAAAVHALASCDQADCVTCFLDDEDASVVRVAVTQLASLYEPALVRDYVEHASGPHRDVALSTLEYLLESRA